MKTSLFLVPVMLTAMAISPFNNEQSFSGVGVTAVSSKQNSSFSFLRSHRQGKGVAVAWGVSSAEDIVGFTVQRTYEDPTDPYAYWEDAAVLPCHASRSFTHHDEQVFPGIINYRIVALRSDGTSFSSEVTTQRIVSRK